MIQLYNESWKLFMRRRNERERERFTELMYSRSAALASPSLAGASIWTPTASSLTSPDQTELIKSVNVSKSLCTKEKYKESKITGDGGRFGTRLRVDGDGDGGRRKEAQTCRKARSVIGGGFFRRWCGRIALLSSLRRSHVFLSGEGGFLS